MTVRCKFQCVERKEGIGSKPQVGPDGKTAWVRAPIYTYTFNPVFGTESEENKRLWEATPTGKLEIGAIHEDLFQVGRFYYLDVTSVDIP